MKKLSALRQDEVYFIFMILRSYGGMEDPSEVESRNKRNKRNKRKPQTTKRKTQNKSIPSLYNLNDPKWKTCKDEKLLIYKALLEKALIEN